MSKLGVAQLAFLQLNLCDIEVVQVTAEQVCSPPATLSTSLSFSSYKSYPALQVTVKLSPFSKSLPALPDKNLPFVNSAGIVHLLGMQPASFTQVSDFSPAPLTSQVEIAVPLQCVLVSQSYVTVAVSMYSWLGCEVKLSVPVGPETGAGPHEPTTQENVWDGADA